ncbi:MAG TPA: signal peptidase I [Thermoplasmata archaeon]|nr:signal peptidase I [Thermoplasmata archaeon]
MSEGADRSNPIGQGGARTGRQSVLTALAVSGAGVALSQGYSLSVRGLTGNESYLGLIAVAVGLLGLLWLGARLERRPLRDFGFAIREPLPTTLTFASLLILVFVALRLDPGFFFGFGKIPPTPVLVFGFLLLSAPVIAVAQVGLFFGFLFRTLARHLSLRSAMLLAAGIYAVNSTNFSVLAYVGVTAGTQFLFSTTVVAFVLGIVLSLYYYKSRWSLVGPITVTASLAAVAALLPVGVRFPSWEADFAGTLIAYAVLLLIVGFGLEEPRLQKLKYLGERVGARRYRFRSRAHDRAAFRGALVTVAVVGVAAISFAYGLPVVLGNPSPVLAIATGSMVPTLHRGDLVVVEHVGPAAITVGTIIAFHVSCLPAPTVHRVIRIVSTGPGWVYQTKGDANPTQDPCTVPYADVLGAVIVHEPYLGFLILDRLFAASLVVLAILVPVVWRGEKHRW